MCGQRHINRIQATTTVHLTILYKKSCDLYQLEQYNSEMENQSNGKDGKVRKRNHAPARDRERAP